MKFPAQKAMINLQVDDVEGLLDRLTAEGVEVDPETRKLRVWLVHGPEGNRVELLQPVANN
jgi:hypothetical protein